MGANSSSPEGLAKVREQTRPREATPFRLLTVRIMRARNLQKADIFTESDCYVCLWLPTASSEKVRTKTVPNTKDPVWNQAFCYRIDSRVKNILNLKICDEDTFTKDDHLYTVLFDLAKLQTGQTSRVSFKLNPETHEELDVEFTLQCIPDHPENIITNGVLVARELSCLEVMVDIKKLKQLYTKGDLTFTIQGSYEETQKIPLAPDSSLSNIHVIQFHCIKNHQSNLEITLPKKLGLFKDDSESNTSVVLPLNELPIEETITLGEDRTFDLHVKTKDWPKDLDVRLGYDLCAEEQNFLNKRRKYVAAALEKVLQLQEGLQDDEVPVVAIMTTGGGTRSFTAMYGSLLGLQELNLLDCITYITGLSGTTWAMGNLYEDADWSQKYMEEAINKAQKQVSKSKFNSLCMDKLKYYYNELKQRTEEGHNTSFIDLWGLVVESMFHDEKDNHTLSDQRAALSKGQNPLPIYLAINLKDNYSAQDYKEWLEFTPYEMGSFKYGAYIGSEDFGSEYFMGRLMKTLPESRICFLEGMWSSIFSLDFMFFWNLANNSEDFWHRWTRDKIEEIDDSVPPSRPHELETHIVTSQGQLSSSLRDVLTGRPTIAEYPNFLRGFQFHNEYYENEHFSTWKKDTVLDNLPNQLMETAEHPLSLVEAGFFINTSYPPLLRPQRKVDLILHLNYSGGPQIFNLDRFSPYTSKLGIPFPKTEFSEEDRKHQKECYVFEDTDNVAAPVVLFFPLTNDTFRKYKEPGVERSPTDTEGDVDVCSWLSPYTTKEVTFSEENFHKMIKLTRYNILNNENKIVEALRVAMKRRKQKEL